MTNVCLFYTTLYTSQIVFILLIEHSDLDLNCELVEVNSSEL